MATAATKVARKDPFDLHLSGDTLRDLTRRLVDEIRTGKQARALIMDDQGLIDFAYSLYEQRSQQGISRDTPRYGSADLTSPIGTENVDALSSRAAHTIFKQEPLWIVEGLGDSAQKAPIVEEFMQWRQEAIRLQQVAKRGITASLVETGAVLEVCEDAERSIRRETVKAAVQRNEMDGSIVLDEKSIPLPARDETGAPVPAGEGDDAVVEVHHVYPDYRRRGSYVRVVGMKDFMMLPNHATDPKEVWGHATRFFVPLADLKRRAKEGEFKAEAVEQLGGDSQERPQSAEADRTGVTVSHTPGYDMGEKELWRVQCWLDLDGKGLTFYTAIISEQHDQILSLKYDWLQAYRTVYLNPFPCPYSVYGYSMILTKLLTTIEEHTAWRNMNADRETLNVQKPILRKRGSQWEPAIQPFGAGEVFDVDSPDEITTMPFEGISVQAMNKEQQCVVDAQRLIGMNDIAIGQVSEKSRTLGENRMATQQSFVRTDDPIANINEALEEVGRLIHAIEVQTLKEMEEGLPAPASVTQSLQYKDASFEGTFTADMIAGDFRFKPRGSSESADPTLRKRNTTELFGQVGQLAQVNPFIAQRVQSQEFADAAMQMLVDDYKPRNRAAFLAPLQSPAMPGAPGLPPGAPGEEQVPQFGGQVLQELLAQMPAGAQPS